jgi:hypothetical protein
MAAPRARYASLDITTARFVLLSPASNYFAIVVTNARLKKRGRIRNVRA